MLKNKVKLFSLGFVVGLILLTIIIYPVEYGIRHDSNVYTVKNDNFLKNIDDIQVVVLGSSHALFGISAGTISKHAFNLSNVNQTYNYDREFLRKYIDKMPNLRVVIISLSPFSFKVQMGVENIDFRQFYYKHFLDIIPSELSLNETLLQKFLWTFALGFTRSINDVYMDTSTSQIDNLGDYSAPIGNADTFQSLGEGNAKRHGDIVVKPEILKVLQDIKALLDEKGVQLLLVGTPTLSFYNKNYTKQDMDDFYKKTLQSLNLSRENFFSEFYGDDYGYVASDFHDPDHLSKQGSIKFSTNIRQYLLKNQDVFGNID